MSPALRPHRVAAIGLLVNFALAAIKLLAGLVGHSYALIADAIESMADILGSVVIWGGLRIGARPPDANHPYGHGKAEALAALAVACLIFAAGIAIAVQSIREILTPHHAPAAFTLGVLVVVVAVKELMFRLGRGSSRGGGGDAILIDAWHHRSDAITSAAAFVGISVALIGGPGYEPADDWAALLASGVILFNAWRLVRMPLRELMDAQPEDIPELATAAARTVPGVLDVEQTNARKMGAGYWVDMHIEVDPQISVLTGHQVAHDVSDTVRARLPRVDYVLVHVEPHRPDGTQ